jgi:hypothetical protein
MFGIVLNPIIADVVYIRYMSTTRVADAPHIDSWSTLFYVEFAL